MHQVVDADEWQPLAAMRVADERMIGRAARLLQEAQKRLGQVAEDRAERIADRLLLGQDARRRSGGNARRRSRRSVFSSQRLGPETRRQATTSGASASSAATQRGEVIG